MKNYTIRNQNSCLHICLTTSNIKASIYKATEIGPGMDSLELVGSWHLHALNPDTPVATRMAMTRLVQRASGDISNDIIQHILTHPISREHGDFASKHQSSTLSTHGSSLPKPTAMSQSIFQQLKQILK